jgi:Domain of unknown function (DUF4424)
MPHFMTRAALRGIAAVALCFLVVTAPVRADDGAASIAAGGIVMTREPRITMQKEVLRISESNVQVDYEFRNDIDTAITTEVAFPVPAYSLDWDEHSILVQGFDDFRLSVEGAKVRFDVEVRAKLKGRDVSATLNKYGIDIATFGHFDEESHFARDIRRLSGSQRSALVKAGLINPETDQDEATWSVEKKYYWQQTFPAHSVIHISHQYTPVLGSTNSVRYGLSSEKDADPVMVKEIASLCVDPALRNTLGGIAGRADKLVPYSYVDFILTTANTWKTPIEDFTLIVERPHWKNTQQNFVSFCWDGPITKIDADHFSAHLNNLVPKKELRIGFISVMNYSQ